MVIVFLLNIFKQSDSSPYISSDTIVGTPCYDDESTTPQNEQIETFHDPQKTFNDTHKISDEFVEQTQHIQNTLTFDTTTTIQVEKDTDAHEPNTDAHSFTVTTDSNLPNIPTRQIEHENNDNRPTSIQYDPSTISTQNTASSPQPIFPQH